jgi:hypothetical protein
MDGDCGGEGRDGEGEWEKRDAVGCGRLNKYPLYAGCGWRANAGSSYSPPGIIMGDEGRGAYVGESERGGG